MSLQSKKSLSLGLRVGESLQVGDVTLTLAKVRCRTQVQVRIQALETVPIARSSYVKKTRNSVQGKSSQKD
jgi:sRNA-binding carbon storage regulator CsrA